MHFTDLQTALLAAPALALEDEYSPFIQIAVLVHPNPQVLPSTQPGTPGLPETDQPLATARLRAVSDHPFDLGVGPFSRAVVPTLPSFMERPHQFHVFLRHRPRSIAQGSGAGVSV